MKNNKRAFLLVELLVAIAIISTVFVTLFFLQSKLLQIKQDGIMKVRATYYAQEAFEALRYLRAINTTNGWSEIASQDTDADYDAIFTDNAWSLKKGESATLDGIFTRTIRFATVNRENDEKGVINPAGITDAGTRKVTVTVSWGDGKSVMLDTYFTNWTSDQDL